MESPDHERRNVEEYFRLESPEDDSIARSEKIASESIYGDRHDVWEVEAESGRWWVITNPTNLYRQDDFPSMEVVLSFHVGLVIRTIARQARELEVSDEQRDRTPAAWRKIEQAAKAIDAADEAEEFQAVGMRCREALVKFARDAAESDRLQIQGELPKKADFVGWSKVIADAAAPGAANKALRTYLKTTAKATWDLVAALTHDDDATRHDAEISLSGTETTLAAFTDALVRYERGAPDRCPSCESYRLAPDFRPEIGDAGEYVTICANCGWESGPQPEGVIQPTA
jgi:hypothetical protein